MRNFEYFYEKPNKVDQDQAILHLLDITQVARKRPKVQDVNRQKGRSGSVKYSLNHPEKVPVCKATFIKVFGISKDCVSRVAPYYAETAEARPERRGGARHSEEHARRRQLIVEHIQSFTCRTSHYGRRGAPGRKYLPSDLNVHKMHELFEAQSHAQTSYSLYYSVFSKEFNLGFGHPATDACADCAKYNFRITDPNLTDTEKRMESASFI
ncbi:uncharacterized protein LOC121694269 [Alosa sapidissima]|uniref:uncharacterized protein LOC121694269 n=1 Tax=Alosa sapidissima TaxID=34773 RepID=UPI001C07F3FD|nr:uncharacterized protein LOC121694269 [Alosa sapidissima]